MKKRWFILLFPSIVIISFFLPAVKLYIHSQIGPQIAALFPPAFPGYITSDLQRKQ